MSSLYQRILNGVVYDCIQTMAGARTMDRHLSSVLPQDQCPRRVLDLGGGTGHGLRFCPPGAQYLCLDLELPKLQRFRSRYDRGLALVADAKHTPLRDNSIDLVTCIAVAHHIDGATLPSLFTEVRRVLVPGGCFLFVDPVWSPGRLQSRLMWSIDRGAYPRTSATLFSGIESAFSVMHREEYRIYHDYLIVVASKP